MITCYNRNCIKYYLYNSKYTEYIHVCDMYEKGKFNN